MGEKNVPVGGYSLQQLLRRYPVKCFSLSLWVKVCFWPLFLFTAAVFLFGMSHHDFQDFSSFLLCIILQFVAGATPVNHHVNTCKSPSAVCVIFDDDLTVTSFIDGQTWDSIHREARSSLLELKVLYVELLNKITCVCVSVCVRVWLCVSLGSTPSWSPLLHVCKPVFPPFLATLTLSCQIRKEQKSIHTNAQYGSLLSQII